MFRGERLHLQSNVTITFNFNINCFIMLCLGIILAVKAGVPLNCLHILNLNRQETGCSQMRQV